MNWYKKAKLINLDPPRTMNLECMYCKRWATNSDSELVDREDAIWKKQSELDEEESLAAKMSKEDGPSSGICSYCEKIMKEMKDRKLPLKSDIIRNLSLSVN